MFLLMLIGWLQNGLHILCHWEYGVQEQSDLRGDCGATGSCFSYFAYTQCCFYGNFFYLYLLTCLFLLE